MSQADLLLALASALFAHAPQFPAGYGWSAGAQIEHESAWRVNALRVWQRETGCGLTQVTKVDGRFDNLTTYARRYQALNGWSWANCSDVEKQMTFFAVFSNEIAMRVPAMNDSRETRAISVAAYNAGIGGITLDRRVCAITEGCDVKKWFGHVGKVCARTAIVSGKRACDITRSYVTKVMSEGMAVKYGEIDAEMTRLANAEKEKQIVKEIEDAHNADTATRSTFADWLDRLVAWLKR